MTSPHDSERISTVVIGGGQAGLSIGYHLARHRIPFVIIEAKDRVGDTWRDRWDSLRLFTPARYDGLDGMPFPARPSSFPSKDEMADYLESYAARFALPIRTGVRVEHVSRSGEGFLVETTAGPVEADQVVVAMASYQAPKVPPFAVELKPETVQLHSLDYRNPAVFRPGPVLVVGAGNSGAEIALEAARSHRTFLSGRPTGQIPFSIESALAHKVLIPVVFRVLFHHVLTVRTPIGRRARRKVISQGGPLIRTKREHLAAAGVEFVPRVVAVKGGAPIVADNRVLDVANVVWCTGFHSGLSWLDLPIFGKDGEPLQARGLVPGQPGLYFVGQHFQYAFSSTMIHGVGRDARRIADAVARHASAAARQPAGQSLMKRAAM